MRKPVQMTPTEMEDCVEFQKRSIESFAKFSHKYSHEKNFEIFAIGITLIISNIMSSHGVTKIDMFMDELSDNIKRTYKLISDNASYMQFDKGKKISEGNYN